MRAYVLINALPGRALEVVDKIRSVPGVTAADAITGQYDVIASFEARDFAVLGSAVVDKIQKLDGVRRTVTCLVLTE
jgi:DNA-binding Lrp family transcriptional regulator